MVGQDEAVIAVSDAVRRARAGLQDPNRPIGSFLFLGPTGVGKTELTKALAEFLFDDEQRDDPHRHERVHGEALGRRLIGAPPGYVGYDEGGALTEAVRRRPYQVILFDEVEKAHPDVFNVLLQVLDDGRLTDGQGRTVDFRNTLIVMTSNLGSEYLAALPDGDDVDAVRDQVMEVVRHAVPARVPQPARRDHPVPPAGARRDGRHRRDPAARLQKLLDRAQDHARARRRRRALAGRRGYDPVYGARPLKRVIQRELQNPLAEKILAGRIADGETVHVTTSGEDSLKITGDGVGESRRGVNLGSISLITARRASR